MADCKHLEAKLVDDDIFGHPDYDCFCKLTGKQVIPCIYCNENRCENYESGEW